MAQRWLSVVDAAEELGVRPALLRHQIITGEVTSRFGEHGRQVLVGEPEPGVNVAEMDHTPRIRRLALVSWVAVGLLAVLAAMLYTGALRNAQAGDAEVATRSESIEATLPPVR